MKRLQEKLAARASYSLLAIVVLAFALSGAGSRAATQKDSGKKDGDKKDEKKKETLAVKRITVGMGLSSIGPLSPDRRSVALVAAKPDKSPNLYVMDLSDMSIRPAITDMQWGVSDPQWSPDGLSIAFAGNNENGSFSELYLVTVKTAKARALTANSFTDKEPVFTPDGKRILYTTDESPLPDAAFGILHVASVAVGGGKPEYFTEDETSSIQPAISADGKSVLLVKISEASGRHSLWQYGLDGKPQRDLTERRFARIHRYIVNAPANTIVLWAQEEAEQQENIYILDLKSGEARMLADADLPKRYPAISPDGALIAYISPTGSGRHLFVYDSTSGETKQLTFKGANTFSPVFITNDQILFGSDRDKSSELYSISLTPPAEEKEKKK